MSLAADVRAFLRDRGMADEVVEAGAEGLVARWEQAARDAEREAYPFGIEDWLNDLDGRQLLAELLAALGRALDDSLRARLGEADTRVLAATEPAPGCLWGDALARRLAWSPKCQWWYWRRPRHVHEDFEGEA